MDISQTNFMDLNPPLVFMMFNKYWLQYPLKEKKKERTKKKKKKTNLVLMWR